MNGFGNGGGRRPRRSNLSEDFSRAFGDPQRPTRVRGRRGGRTYYSDGSGEERPSGSYHASGGGFGGGEGDGVGIDYAVPQEGPSGGPSGPRYSNGLPPSAPGTPRPARPQQPMPVEMWGQGYTDRRGREIEEYGRGNNMGPHRVNVDGIPYNRGQRGGSLDNRMGPRRGGQGNNLRPRYSREEYAAGGQVAPPMPQGRPPMPPQGGAPQRPPMQRPQPGPGAGMSEAQVRQMIQEEIARRGRSNPGAPSPKKQAAMKKKVADQKMDANMKKGAAAAKKKPYKKGGKVTCGAKMKPRGRK